LPAAGGIVDGATMAAATVRIGLSRSEETTTAPYGVRAENKRIQRPHVGDTAILSIYGPEWPDQAMRAIVNDGTRVALGRESEAIRDAKGQVIGSTVLNGQTIPVPRYSVILPTRDFHGDIEQACLAAGTERRQHRRNSGVAI
jgi:hypothetical protein